MRMAARDMGVTVSDAVLAREIAAMQAFQDDQGNFDKTKYANLLRANNLSEAEFEQIMRNDLRKLVIFDSLRTATVVPDSVASARAHFQDDARVAEVVEVKISEMEKPAEPDEATLAAYHEKNARAFTAPEYRKVTAIALTPENIGQRIEVSDDDIAALYEERRDEFSTPETRTVQQLLLDDKAQADRAAELLAGGAGFADIAAALGVEPIDMGQLTAKDLPKQSSDAIFSTAAGQVTEPVESPIGWHVFRVEDIAAPSVRTLDDVSARLRQDIVDERALGFIYDLSANLDDAIGGGATLDEAAAELSLPLIHVPAIDRDGFDRDGEKVTGLPAPQTFVAEAFRAEVGLESGLVEIPNGFFILRVDEVIEPALRPLAEVRAEVLARWRGEKMTQAAQARARDLRARLESGETAEAVGATATAPFTRDGLPGGTPAVPADLAGRLFDLNIGQAAVGRVQDGFLVARVVEDIPVQPDADRLAGLEETLVTELARDIGEQYVQALTERYGAEVNQAKVQQVLQ